MNLSSEDKTSAGNPTTGRASVRSDSQSGAVHTIFLAGSLDKDGVGPIWNETLRMADQVAGRELLIDVSGVEKFDTAGAGLIAEIRFHCEKQGKQCDLEGLSSEFESLLSMFETRSLALDQGDEATGDSFLEQVGQSATIAVRRLKILVEFIGECSLALLVVLRHPSRLRWQDVLVIAEKAGVNGFPIIVLVGFLMGLIMAFQSAIPLKRFGAELYVANLLAISMVRELGPLVTSILLAGRTGSAFAAEIGTMKVNEEVDALTTMGLDPIRFLAAPVSWPPWPSCPY